MIVGFFVTKKAQIESLLSVFHDTTMEGCRYIALIPDKISNSGFPDMLMNSGKGLYGWIKK